MAKRKKWKPEKMTVCFESVRDSEFTETLAELGRLIYLEFCSRQLRIDQDSHCIAASADKIVSAKHERSVANE